MPSVVELVTALPFTRSRAEIGHTEAELLQRLSDADAALSAALGLLAGNSLLRASEAVFAELSEKRRTQSRNYHRLSGFAELQS